MISTKARQIATRRAAEDRDLLARLIREGRVRLDTKIATNVPGARGFQAEIEALSKATKNLAIRPRKRR